MENLIIRQEQQKDYNSVFRVVKEAFRNAPHADGDEQDLVERLRKTDAFVPELSLVAEIDDVIVGHIMFTKMTVDDRTILVLAPLAVAPEYQRMGIGGRLIEEGHRIAKDLDYDAINVVGHETYYPKFGYEEASDYDIKAPFDVPSKNFMILFLKEAAKDYLKGTVAYDPCFFDKSGHEYFDDENRVEEYIDMSKDYVGTLLIKVLHKFVQEKASVLELGMGPGKDLVLLSERYRMTGTDSSAVFVNRFKKEHPDFDVRMMDAVTLDTDDRYDCIYSNKVLQHLTVDELVRSVENQYDHLAEGGYVQHSFWYGEGEEVYDGLRFVYYDEDQLKKIFGERFEIVEIERYREEEDDDSVYIVCRKNAR